MTLIIEIVMGVITAIIVIVPITTGRVIRKGVMAIAIEEKPSITTVTHEIKKRPEQSGLLFFKNFNR